MATEDDDPFASVDLLPERERASNPWLQIVRDLTAPAPVSTWAAAVTMTRIAEYDQIRTFVTRGLLLATTAILMAFAAGTAWITWALLLPAVVQVAFEIYLDFQLYAPIRTRLRPLEILVKITEEQHNVTLTNFTGVVGLLAVPCNIVAVAYATGPGEPSWVKVAALATAAAYGVSAMVNFVTDTTNYSVHQKLAGPVRVFRTLHPYIWVIVAALMTALVAGSVAAQRWSPTVEPLAWALCVLPAIIGTKQRDYERFLRASSEVLPDIQTSAKNILAKDYHNTNTDIRVFNRELAVDTSVPPGIRVKAAALAPLISLMSEAIDHDQWVKQQERPSLNGIADKCGSDSSLKLTNHLQLDDLSPENYEIARTLITALLVNVGQALIRGGGDPNEYRVTVEGIVRDGQVHIAVRDLLPMIDPWCAAASTTRWLHDDLVARGGRGLSQHPVDERDPGAGKEIRASWPVKKPPMNLRDARR